MPFRFKYLLLILPFLIMIDNAISQRYQWAKSIPKAGAIYSNIAIDSNSNTYMTGLFRDTLNIDSNIIPPPTTSKFEGNFLGRFNKYGKLKWCKQLYVALPSTSSYASFYIQGLVSVTNNQILVYGSFYGGTNGALKLSKNDSIMGNVNGNTGFIAVYDSLGNLIKSTSVFDGPDYGTSGYFINGKSTKDSKGNIYIQFLKSKSGKGHIKYVGGSVALTDTIIRFVVIKYSPNLDSILWYKEFPLFNNFLVLRISTGEDDNLYLACNGLYGSFTLNSKNYKVSTQAKGFLTILSPSGAFVHTGFINDDTTNGDQLWDMKAKNINSIYLLGTVQDSILIQGKWHSSPIKKKSAGDYPFIGKMSISKGAKWIKFSPNTTNRSIYTSGGNVPGQLAFDKFNSVYASFYLWSQGFAFGGLKDTNYVTHPFLKLDSIGNALWMRSYDFRADDFQADYDTNLVFAGAYSGQINFNPFTLKSKYTSLYLAKIIDYSIKRGFVSNVPYCAGDTIQVPFSKRGIYDTSNYFIAELSDENGNFEGKERELGRLKTIDQGIVKGVLPMFKVASSNKYRIRVRSTNPIVQSFYKVDTLRLLIYSRDKADPGPTETICYGDSILLNTYGGTKWTWSPKINMMDSTQRQTLAWPKTATTYKIIIGDSSGCGAPDTAYKLVLVRQPLKVILNYKDTALCENIVLSIPFQFKGGDSLNYSYQWYFLNSKTDWFPTKSGKNKVIDTLFYPPSDPLENLAIILKDGCTNKPDTAFLTISQRQKVTIKSNFKDNSLCSGHKLNYKATGTGGVTKYLKYQWKDLITNTVLSNTDSLAFTTSKTEKIQLIVNDGCEALGDTAMFEVKVKAKLRAQSNLSDTTLCFGKNLNLSAKATGGDTAKYAFNWLLDKKIISSSNSLVFKTEDHFLTTGETKKLILVLKDNCSLPNDSVIKTITVKPSPKANFSYDLACSRTTTNFQFTGTKPGSPTTTTFNWDFNKETNSTLENPSKLFSTIGTKKVKLTITASNGCVDTLTKAIDIKFQSQADFSVNDVCATDSAIFINKSKDATGYNWKFGDGNNSNKEAPKHKYQITSTTTFNVTLVAIVQDGCSDSISIPITINELPNSNFSISRTGQVVDLKANKNGLSSYKWVFGTTDSITKTTNTHTQTLKTNVNRICLTVTDNLGCQSQTCKDPTIGIKSINANKIKIYPNPASETITIETTGLENQENRIQLINSMGQVVIEEISNFTFQISIGHLSEGVYLVRLICDGKVWSQKVIVKRIK